MTRQIFLILGALILVACGNPEKAWQMAERDDTPTAYLEFLAKYPDGEQAELARERIEALKVIRAWERAEFKADESGYRNFIEKFPDSDYVAAAEDRLLAIQREEDWQIALETRTDVSITTFIERYPDAPQVEEARVLLAELQTEVIEEPPPERAGNFRLQLAVFRTPESAEMESIRLVDLFPDTFLGPLHIETPEERGSGRIYRLLSVPMNAEEARTVCEQLQKKRQECLIINR
jgi:hypothetical protein